MISTQGRRSYCQILKILTGEAPLWLNCAQDLIVGPDPTGVVRLGHSALDHIGVRGGSLKSHVFEPRQSPDCYTAVVSLPDGLGVVWFQSDGRWTVFV